MNSASPTLSDWRARAGQWWDSITQLEPLKGGKGDLEREFEEYAGFDVPPSNTDSIVEVPIVTELEGSGGSGPGRQLLLEIEGLAGVEGRLESGFQQDLESEEMLAEGAEAAPIAVEFDRTPTIRIEKFQVKFEFDSASLSAEATELLDAAVELVSRSRVRAIVVAGYSDRHGDEEYNLALSHRRAEVVAQYLLESGVDRSHLSVQGHGSRDYDGQVADKHYNDESDGRITELQVELESFSEVAELDQPAANAVR